MSISDTMFNLKEKDYYRWQTIREMIHSISRRVFNLVARLREEQADALSHSSNQLVQDDVLVKFDKLVMGIGQMNFADFVDKLRSSLNALSHRLSELTRDKV